MGFDASNQLINQLFNISTRLVVPRNQRKYVWEERNWNEFYEDLEYVCKGTFEHHFIGSVVLKNEGHIDDLNQFSIIDGQQRIITITILLTTIIYWFKRLDIKNQVERSLNYITTQDENGEMVSIVESEPLYILSQSVLKIAKANPSKYA